MSEFSPEELKHFAAYERVRQGGRFNMFDPQARRATRLTPDEYLFVMNNYVALRDQAAAAEKHEGSGA